MKKYFIIYISWILIGFFLGIILALAAAGQDGVSAIFVPIGGYIGIGLGGIHSTLRSLFTKKLLQIIVNSILLLGFIVFTYYFKDYQPTCDYPYSKQEILNMIEKKMPNTEQFRGEISFDEFQCFYYFGYEDKSQNLDYGIEYIINKKGELKEFHYDNSK